MANTGRKIGVNIFTLMQNAGLSREELARKLSYSYRDMCRILEGKLMLPPVEADKFVPELQNMKELSDTKNLDKILDLLDEYVDLKEAM